MKIRILNDWADVVDSRGKFSIRGVSVGASGMTLAEVIATGYRFTPTTRIVVTATYMDSRGALVGTRLCDQEFSSCDAAAEAARAGFEVSRDVLSEEFARRLVASRAAEVIK